jgi:hypothetical protein
MAHLDRSILDQIGSALRPEYDPLVASSLPQKLRELLFQQALAEAALSAERGCSAARLRLRDRVSHLLSHDWSDEAAA